MDTNILLVILDSARAENMSLYGYERETTPFLEEFADRSTVYTQARAPGIHSIASHVSMFTGDHVDQHEALNHTAQIDPERSIWTELHTDFGYETGLFTNNRIVSNASNLGDHFQYQFNPDYSLAKRLENTLGHPAIEKTYFRLEDTAARIGRFLSSLTGGRVGSAVDGVRARLGGAGGETDNRAPEGGFKTLYGGEFTGGFLDWQSTQNDHWAACINLMDTHSPFHPEPEFDRWADADDWDTQANNLPSVRETLAGEGWDRLQSLEPLYDGTILQADTVLKNLVNELESRGELDDTLLIITSDHGEAFGEESTLDPDIRIRDHKWGVPEALTHVPLLVNYPGQTDGRVVDDVVSLTDLPALMRATAEDAEDIEGSLLAPELVLASTFRLPEAKTTKYASVEGVENYVGPWRAVYEDHDGTVRKYARHGDDSVTLDIDGPGEVTVVERDDGGRVAEVYDRLEKSGVLTERTTEIDDELEEKLEDLGYIR
jgi:arylsulfatase A-like enzyme